jgi:F-type H+-transporting ATPase subunit epsilon
LECEATFVAFPAHDGEIGILTRRAPLVCKMGIGPLRIETGEEQRLLFVDGGFAQGVGNRLTLLTEQARRVEELDTAAAERALVEAHVLKITDDASFDARDKAIKRAQIQLKIARSTTSPR